ncbi:MAG: MarR family winged helix-turn-helix transcriptional regulator [Ottowia sp.]|uniref:MarR family winged helix-turn-helix transcriptional regulator n=1 Tax=unclassified Ottowia TaxID=2645081 RepID=UPI003C2CA48C
MPRTPSHHGVDVTQNLSFRIIQLTSTLNRSAANAIPKEVGISVPQWRLISVIGSRPDISFSSLVQILEIDKGWISRSLVKLQEEGLVISTPDPMDKRKFTLNLTDQGREVHLRGSRISKQRQKQLQAEFTAQEYQTLKTLLDRLQQAAERLE